MDFSQALPLFVYRLRALVELESPSSDKAAVDRVGAFVSGELHRLGAQVKIDVQAEVGNHIIGRWGQGSSTGILLLSHIDTVHPVGTILRNPCVEQDGKLFGPGTQDMKGGIAVFLGVVENLQEMEIWPSRPITALFTTDEEIGSRTSRKLIEGYAQGADLVLCLEPCLADGGLKIWRKGVGDYEIIARGRAAHAGASHADGLNAVEELAHQVLRIQGWTDYKRGTTLNVGTVQGGTVTNVVPAEARARVDLRVMVPEEAERIDREMQNLCPVLYGATIEVHGSLNRPPMPPDERMIATFERARAIAKGLGLDLKKGGTGGGSDANFVAPLGVPLLDGLGPLGDGQHSEHEYIVIDSLAERAALLSALITQW